MASHTATSRVVCYSTNDYNQLIWNQKSIESNWTYIKCSANEQTIGNQLEETYDDAHDENKRKQIVSGMIIFIQHDMLLVSKYDELQHQCKYG